MHISLLLIQSFFGSVIAGSQSFFGRPIYSTLGSSMLAKLKYVEGAIPGKPLKRQSSREAEGK